LKKQAKTINLRREYVAPKMVVEDFFDLNFFKKLPLTKSIGYRIEIEKMRLNRTVAQ
jgi:hypothetical protein